MLPSRLVASVELATAPGCAWSCSWALSPSAGIKGRAEQGAGPGIPAAATVHDGEEGRAADRLSLLASAVMKAGQRIEAVVFDLFYTLVHPGTYPGGIGRVGWLARMLAVDPSDLKTRWAVFEPVLEAGQAPKHADGLGPELGWVRAAAADLGAVVTSTDLARIEADWDLTRRQALLDPPPSAVATLVWVARARHPARRAEQHPRLGTARLGSVATGRARRRGRIFVRGRRLQAGPCDLCVRAQPAEGIGGGRVCGGWQ